MTSALNAICGLCIDHRRRKTILPWNSSGGLKGEFFRASVYVLSTM